MALTLSKNLSSAITNSWDASVQTTTYIIIEQLYQLFHWEGQAATNFLKSVFHAFQYF